MTALPLLQIAERPEIVGDANHVQLARFFQARAGEWIDGRVLERGGHVGIRE